MRLLEEHEQKVEVLRRALIEGEESGHAMPFNMAEIIQEAKQEERLIPRDA